MTEEPPTGFRPDRFGIHFVSLATGNVVDRDEMYRLVAMRELAETKPEPFKGTVAGQLRVWAQENL